jgi:YD repeat-containing protein
MTSLLFLHLHVKAVLLAPLNWHVTMGVELHHPSQRVKNGHSTSYTYDAQHLSTEADKRNVRNRKQGTTRIHSLDLLS